MSGYIFGTGCELVHYFFLPIPICKNSLLLILYLNLVLVSDNLSTDTRNSD